LQLPREHSQFKQRAPRAIKEVRKFAQKVMGTSDVRVDVKLNQFLWHSGIKAVPHRVRVRLSRYAPGSCAGVAVLLGTALARLSLSDRAWATPPS
jgi:ribosomal protein L31E